MDYNAYFLISFPVTPRKDAENPIQTENFPIPIGKSCNPSRTPLDNKSNNELT